jgi:hypothetical protein
MKLTKEKAADKRQSVIETAGRLLAPNPDISS